jgi:hypothetical protein
LVVGTPAALYQFYQYRQQLETEHRFEVSAAMASLIERLTSEDTEPREKRGAAIGLSLIGSAALPVLVGNLDMIHDASVSESIVQGLEDVLRRQKADHDAVLEPLRRATDRIVSRAIADPTADNFVAAALHIGALARLAAAAKETPTLNGRWVRSDKMDATAEKIRTMMRAVPSRYEATVDQEVRLLNEALTGF